MKFFIVDKNNPTIQLLGCNTYINEFPTGRLLRDPKLYEISGGTMEFWRMLIGRELVTEAGGGAL